MGHFQEHRARVLAEQAAQQEAERLKAEKEQARAADPGPADPGPRPEHLTPVQRHKASVAARKNPPPTPAPSRTTGRAAAKKAAGEAKSGMLQAIESLHGLDLKDKIKLKKKLVEQFREPAEKLLEARTRDDDFSAWIVWLYDIGAIEEFMEKAPAAIALGWLTRPLGMQRSLQEFYFDAIREWSEGEFRKGHSPEPYFSTAYAQHGKMKDVVAAKYHKLAGDMLLAQAGQAKAGEKKGILQRALNTLGFAKRAHEKIGVDTRIKETEKALENLPGDTEKTPPAGDGPDAKKS